MELRVLDNPPQTLQASDWIPVKPKGGIKKMPLQVRNDLMNSALNGPVSVVCLQRQVTLTHKKNKWGFGGKKWSSMSTLTGQSSENVQSGIPPPLQEPQPIAELPVFVNGVQKWVTGLSKRTTCDDVIYALLCHTGQAINVGDFKIWERWREVERPLRGRTKIYKVWRAWGTESANVQFYLRKLESPTDAYSGALMVRNKSHRSSSRRHHYYDDSEVMREKQMLRSQRRREVHRSRSQESKTYRSGEFYRSASTSQLQSVHGLVPQPMNDYDNSANAVPEGRSQVYDKLIQIIIDQQKQIQEQSARIQQTDDQIESYESMMHQLRMQANGRDYVQDAYLNDPGEDESPVESQASKDDADAKELQSYLQKLETLQERLAQEEEKIHSLSMQVVEESQVSYVEEPQDISYSQVCNNDSVNVDWDEDKEVEVLKDEIERCMKVGLGQQKHMGLVDQTIKNYDEELAAKRRYLKKLYEEFKSENFLEKVEEEDEDGDSGVSSNNSPQSSPGAENQGILAIPQTVKKSVQRVRFFDDLIEEEEEVVSQETGSQRSTGTGGQMLQRSCEQKVEKKSLDTGLVNAYTDSEWNKYYSRKSSQRIEEQIVDEIESDGGDDASDTGLSSMASEEPPPVLETLV